MPKNLTDVSVFTDPIEVPTDGDPLAEARLEVPWQGLANRTRYLQDQTLTLTEKIFTVSAFSSYYEAGWALASATSATLRASVNSAEVFLPLDFLPDGSVINKIEARVNPGGVMTMDIRKVDFDWTSGSGTQIEIESGIVSTAVGIQTMSSTGSLGETVSKVGRSFIVRITANASAGSSVDDLFGWRITADVPGGKA